MQKISILLFSLVIFINISCKKGCIEGEQGLPLENTNWNLYFKNNSTFTFFAESQLYFNANKEVVNYRSADTINGNWESSNSDVTLTFSNGDIYNGTAITSDSISGTLTASGNNGIWYATKR
ncbi:MAG TPA: hypothetical protein PK546_06260 [Chitinophagales bacterium]|jgi:hypothetical protein|nr:hypothetical protein [Chitinophagales bacterium]HOY41208.1 hypothetical protein [Chitinophagales bacterium]HPN19127.1 hypothetical protein [Chitinophagales bacterium]